MAVSVLNAAGGVAQGSAYTASAGTNRIVVITHLGEAASGATIPVPTEITWGIATLSGGKIKQAVLASTTEATAKATCGVWYILDSDIPAGSNTFTSTWNVGLTGATTPNSDFYTLDGVKQGVTCVENTSTDIHNIGSEADPWSSTIAVVAGTVQILSAIVHTNVASTQSAGWTEDQDSSQSNWRIVSHYITSAAAGTVTYGLDFAAPAAGAVAVASFAPISGSIDFTTTARGAFRGISRGL